MSVYHVEFTKEALKALKKMDCPTAALIFGWIKKNLEGCEDPRIHGKGDTANRSGQLRYRVGNCRLVCDIIDDRVVILVLNIGHRRDVYL